VARTTLPYPPSPKFFTKLKSPSDTFRSSCPHWRTVTQPIVQLYGQKKYANVRVNCVNFWVFPWHLVYIGWRFGTLCQVHLQRFKPLKIDQTPGNHPNVDTVNTEHGESLRSRICQSDGPWHWRHNKRYFVITTSTLWKWQTISFFISQISSAIGRWIYEHNSHWAGKHGCSILCCPQFLPYHSSQHNHS
jgi:hypothetical protein